jgi:hypothetical protein
VRADEPTDEHGATSAPLLHRVDTKPDEAVVDEYVVPGLEDVSDHGGRDGQLAVGRRLLGADRDLVARVEDDGLLQLADPELRALQVADQRNRPTELRRDLANEPRALGVIGVGAVREVEADRVDARLDEGAEALARVRSGPERGDDLGATVNRHRGQGI